MSDIQYSVITSDVIKSFDCNQNFTQFLFLLNWPYDCEHTFSKILNPLLKTVLAYDETILSGFTPFFIHIMKWHHYIDRNLAVHIIEPQYVISNNVVF